MSSSTSFLLLVGLLIALLGLMRVKYMSPRSEVKRRW